MSETENVTSHDLLTALAASLGIDCVLFVALVIYARRQRAKALRGDPDAVKNLLLPVFHSTLGFLAFAAFTSAAMVQSLAMSKINNMELAMEAGFACRLFLLALPPSFALQKAVTVRAFVGAVIVSLLLAMYNLPIVWTLRDGSVSTTETTHYVPLLAHVAFVLPFVWISVRPPAAARAIGCWAIREYCSWVYMYMIFSITRRELLQARSGLQDAAFVIGLLEITCGSLTPFAAWRLLQAATRRWRELGQRAVTLHALYRQSHPAVERTSARGLHLLVEMHRKFVLDFAYLDVRRRLGGNTYSGELYGQTTVAITAHSVRAISDETVGAFAHTAALFSALHQHPNVATFYGLCLCPPAVYMVSELCQGSLAAVTQSVARRRQSSGHARRQQLLIDVNYMVDAVRAVAFLHSFSPAFLHRDISARNFLVDEQSVVKLGSVAEARHKLASDPRRVPSEADAASHDGAASVSRTGTERTEPSTSNGTTIGAADRDYGWEWDASALDAAAAAYVAPELVQGRAALYGEAADMYSLAMTLWDVLYPLADKFPAPRGDANAVLERAARGERPAIAASCHPELRRLIREAWDPRPERRPSATYLLSALEALQEEASHPVADSLRGAMKPVDFAVGAASTPPAACVRGEALAKRMLELGMVESAAEATRLGNALMSGGLLHHANHQAAFAAASEQHFFFDDGLDDDSNDGHAWQQQRDTFPARASDTISLRPAWAAARSSSFGGGGIGGDLAQPLLSPVPMLSPARGPSLATASSHYTLCTELDANAPRCACRRLGRAAGPTRGERRQFQRNHKWFAIVDESILSQKALLATEASPADWGRRLRDRRNAASRSPAFEPLPSPEPLDRAFVLPL